MKFNLEHRLPTKRYQGRLQPDDLVALQAAILIQSWIRKNSSLIFKKENLESLFSREVDLQASSKVKQLQNVTTQGQKQPPE